MCVGTIKRNDLRTSLKAKELISNARSIKDLGAKTKEQEEEGEGEETRPQGEKQVSKKTYSSYECVGVFIGLGFNAKGQLPLFYIT